MIIFFRLNSRRLLLPSCAMCRAYPLWVPTRDSRCGNLCRQGTAYYRSPISKAPLQLPRPPNGVVDRNHSISSAVNLPLLQFSPKILSRSLLGLLTIITKCRALCPLWPSPGKRAELPPFTHLHRKQGSSGFSVDCFGKHLRRVLYFSSIGRPSWVTRRSCMSFACSSSCARIRSISTRVVTSLSPK